MQQKARYRNLPLKPRGVGKCLGVRGSLSDGRSVAILGFGYLGEEAALAFFALHFLSRPSQQPSFSMVQG
jgi:hypothetical protein